MKKKLPVNNNFLKIGQAAKILGVSIDTLRRWEVAGKLHSIRTLGGTRLYPLETLKTLNPQAEEVLTSMAAEKEAENAPSPLPNPEELSSEKLDFGGYMQAQNDRHPGVATTTIGSLDAIASLQHDEEDDVIRQGGSDGSWTSQHDGEDVILRSDNDEGSLTNVRTSGTSPEILRGVHHASGGAQNDKWDVQDDRNWAQNDRSNVRNITRTSLNLPKIYAAFGLMFLLVTILAAGTFGIMTVSNPKQAEKVASFVENWKPVTKEVGNSAGLAALQTVVPGSGQVLAIATASHFLEINSDTSIMGDLGVSGQGLFTGDLTAPNIIYNIIAGTNVAITGGQTPTISVTLPANIVNTFQGSSGDIKLVAGTDISISNLTISDSSTLSSVRGRGGCSDCILDADVVDTLTISSGGNVSGTAIKTGLVATTYGGTGLTSYAIGDILYASASTTLAKVGIGTSAQVLSVSGGVPVWSDAPEGGVTSVSNSDSTLTISPTTGAVIASLNLGKSNTWTTTQYFSSNVGIGTTISPPPNGLLVSGNVGLGTTSPLAGLDVSGGAILDSLKLGSLTGILKGTSGTVSTATAGVDYQVPLSFTSPIVMTGTTVSLSATTGSGTTVVLADSPTLVTPTLGIATATSINKLTITAPATSATLTIADGKTLTVSNTLTLAGTDSTTMTFPASSTAVAGLSISGQNFTGLNYFTSNVGIGTTVTSATLDLVGTFQYTDGNQAANKVLTSDASGNGTWTAIGTAGGITGTGTTNQVAYWTGTSTQTGSNNFWFDGTNVGIGTTAPLAKLGFAVATTAAGGIDFGGDVSLYRSAANTLTLDDSLRFNGVLYDITTGTNEDLQIVPNGTGDTVFYTDSSSKVYFRVDAAKDNANLWQPTENTLRTDGSFIVASNVGIGTTLPGQRLDLLTGSAYGIAGTSVLNATTLGTGVITSSLTTVGALASGSIASGFGTISTGNTITTTGTMGTAGTTTFTGAGATFSANVNANGGLDVDDAFVIADGGALTTSQTSTFNSNLFFGNSAGILDTNGNVGIGTTTPGANTRLAVMGGNVGIGTTSATALFSVGANNLFQINSSGYAFLPQGAVLTPSLSFVGDTDTGLFSLGADTIGIGTSGTTRMFFGANGNIGIGTTAPTDTFEVAGANSSIGNSTGDFTITSAANLILTPTTNVGIGTTAPTAKLDVNGSLKATTFNGNTFTTGTGILTIAAAKTLTVSNTLTLAGTDSTAMTFPGSSTTVAGLSISGQNFTGLNYFTSNVGIGTTVTSATLDLVGTLQYTDGNQALNKVLTSDASGNATWTAIGTAGGITGTGTTNQVAYWTGTSTQTGSNNFWFDGTNVGIGTTAPVALLNIGTNTTTPAGGLQFGTDTNLYRFSTDRLKTDDSVTIAGSYFDVTSAATFSGNLDLTGTWSQFRFGPSNQANMRFNASQTNNTFTLATDDTTKNFVIVTSTQTADNFVTPANANPTLYLYSNTRSASATNQWLSLSHNQTNGVINTGTGNLTFGQTLTSDTDSTDNLGTTSIAWANLYVDTISSITGNALALTPVSGQSLTVNLATTGDFVVNTNQLYVDTSTGNVGLGTTLPAYTLDVNGSARIGTLNGLIKGTTGVLSAATAGTDYIAGGVGSASQVAYFTGSGVLTGSNTFWFNGTNVGIGTTLPLGLFDVNGLFTVNSNGNVGIGTTNPLAKLSVAGTSTLSNVTGNMTFTPAANLIISSGNVGIGTTSPTALLDVNGALKATTFNGNTFTTGTGILTIGAGKTLTASDTTTLATNSITFAGTEALTLAATKNVTFADAFSTSGAYALTLTTTNTTNVTLPTTGTLATLAGAESFSNKTFTGNTIFPGPGIWDTNGNVGIGTTTPGANTRLAIMGGNVGIGTTAPLATLTANGTMMVNGVTRADGTSIAEIQGAAGAIHLLLEDTSAAAANNLTNLRFTGAGGYRKAQISAGWDAAANTDAYLSLYTRTSGNVTEKLRLTSVGNVGIGTTVPGMKLDVAGDVRSNQSATGGLYYLGSDSLSYIYRTGGVLYVTTKNGDVIDLSGGNVGINTAAPLSKLGVVGNAAIGATYGAFAAPTSGLIVEGNVGIGTTSPTYKLQVNGTGYIGGNAGDSLTIYNSGNRSGVGTGQDMLRLSSKVNTTAGAGGNLVFADENGTEISRLRAYTNTDTTQTSLLFQTGNTASYNNTLFLDYSGNVGIGTVTPSAQLMFGQTATAAQAFAYARGATINTYYLASDSYNGYLDIGVSADNQKSVIRFLTQTAASTAPSESMRISAGNLGIGTTSPGYKLDVNGDINIATGSNFKINGANLSAGSWVASGNNIYNSNSANVGIGTTLPLTSLEVVSGSANSGGDYVVGNLKGASVVGANTALTSKAGNLYISANDALAADNGGTIAFGARYTSSAAVATYASLKGAKENVTDSSMAGYLAFATRNHASNTLVERLRIDSAGNVGIGTTSPLGKLQVITGETVSGLSLLSGSATNYTGIALGRATADGYIGVSDGANIWAAGSAAGDLVIRGDTGKILFDTSAGTTTPAVTILNANGNVGIGTISPQGKLDILSTTNTTTTPLLSIRSDFAAAGRYGMIRFGDQSQTTDYQKGGIIYNSLAGSARGSFMFALENTDGTGSVSIADTKMTILSNGNVGIGTTAPAVILDIVATGNASEQHFTGYANQPQLIGYRANGTAGSPTAVLANELLFQFKARGYNGSAFSGTKVGIDLGAEENWSTTANGTFISFTTTPTGSTTGAERMRIIASGNVGIGTTNPLAKLEVIKDTGGTYDASTIAAIFGDTTAAQADSVYITGNTINGNYSKDADGMDLWLNYRGYLGGVTRFMDLIIGDGKGNNKMILEGSTGNVGIGAASPSQKLEVNGNILIDNPGALITVGRAGTNYGAILANNSTGNNFGLAEIASHKFAMGYWSAFSSVPTGALNAQLTLDTASGNVGIGTTAPLASLEILKVVDGNEVFANFGYNTTHPSRVKIYSNNWYGSLSLYNSSSAEAIRFNSGGTSYLNGGNVGIGTTGPLSTLDIGKLTNAQEGGATLRLMRDYTNNGYGSAIWHGWDATLGDKLLFGVGSNGNPATIANSKMVILNNGNVGIGTTNPTAPLFVSGSVAGAAGTTPILIVQNTYPSSSSGQAEILLDPASTGASWNISANDNSDLFRILQGTDGANPRFSIDGGGNVGINTTTPAYRIDVVGTAGLSTGTAWTNTSDSRFKNIQSNLTGSSLDKIMALKPVSFTWNSLHESKYGADPGLNYGFIAQEVKDIIPEFITQDPDGYYWYNPSGIEALLTAAIQEQQVILNDVIAKTSNITVSPDGSLYIPNLKVDKLELSSQSLEASSQYLEVGTQFASLTSNLSALTTDFSLLESTVSAEIAGVSTTVESLESRVKSLEARVQNQESSSSATLSSWNESSSDRISTPSATTSDSIATPSASLQNDVASLNLTPPDVLLATDSASLNYTLDANNYTLPNATISGKLSAYQATISDTFKALGDSFLGNTTVAGNFSVDGTLSLTGSSLSTLGDLKIQDGPLAGKVDLFNGLITIDNTGKIIAKEVVADKISTKSLELGNETLGEAIIPKDQTEIPVFTTAVTDKSKVFLTPTSPTGGQAIILGSIVPASGFVVKLDHTYTSDIKFNWLLIDTK